MKPSFITDQYYHIYNRGVDKRKVFLCEADYVRFLTCLREFNQVEPIGCLRDWGKRENRCPTPGAPGVGHLFSVNSEPLVEIIAYCLNPNHFHLIVS